MGGRGKLSSQKFQLPPPILTHTTHNAFDFAYNAFNFAYNAHDSALLLSKSQ